MAEFIKSEGGFTVECYGVLDPFSAVYELVTIPNETVHDNPLGSQATRMAIR